MVLQNAWQSKRKMWGLSLFGRAQVSAAVGLTVHVADAFFDGTLAERGAGRPSFSSADATPLGLGRNVG
jgi:hypothetical protein